MKWRVDSDEWYPVYSLYPVTAETCPCDLDFTEEEESKIRAAEEAFNESQALIRGKLEAAGLTYKGKRK